VRRTRSTRRSAESASPPGPPHPPPPVRSKGWTWQIVGFVTAGIVICIGLVANTFGASRDPDSGGQFSEVVITEEPATRTPSGTRTPSLSAPVAVVDGGPETSFELPVGTGVRFSDEDGTWIVALLGVEWIDECADIIGGTVPAVVFDIHYEVLEGAVSIVPVNDFAFVLDDGTTARAGLLSTCAEPALDFTIISAGDIRRGRIAIELPSGSGGGELTYGQLVVPTASWTISGR
jgi:hypothetical protein